MRTVLGLVIGMVSGMVTFYAGLFVIAPLGGSQISTLTAAGLCLVSMVPAMLVSGEIRKKPAAAESPNS